MGADSANSGDPPGPPRNSTGRPSFCPGCGSQLEEAHDFVQPYSVAENRVFHLWCHACNALTEVVFVRRVLAYEPEH